MIRRGRFTRTTACCPSHSRGRNKGGNRLISQSKPFTRQGTNLPELHAPTFKLWSYHRWFVFRQLNIRNMLSSTCQAEHHKRPLWFFLALLPESAPESQFYYSFSDYYRKPIIERTNGAQAPPPSQPSRDAVSPEARPSERRRKDTQLPTEKSLKNTELRKSCLFSHFPVDNGPG